MNKIFCEKLKNLDISITESQINSFEKLFSHLIEENQKYNLTSITEKDKVYLNHFVDSLSALPYIPKNSSLCDIGSGGGFPAIPISIMRDDLKIIMLDSVNKKVNYLNLTSKLFNLKNSVAFHTRIEDFARTKYRQSFDVVTSRAVAKLPTLLEYALPLLKIGGIFIAYKSNFEQELESSSFALDMLGGEFLECKKVCFDDVNRNLLIFKKVKNTPKEFPRGKNKERLDPLI